MNAAPLYQLEGIRRVVAGAKTILDIETLSLPQGAVTAIVGPNGAGKSTLLKILAFLDEPERGTVRFRGRPVKRRHRAELRRLVTMVDQAPLLFQGTVFANVAYGLKVRGVPPRYWPNRVADALSLVDLGGLARRSVRGLSGGEIQRVALARALVFQPQVLLLDEPTAGVDLARMEMIESLIAELDATTGVSVVFSTHNLAQAYRLTDRVIHLAAGKRVPGGDDNLFVGHVWERGGANLVRLRSGATLWVGAEIEGRTAGGPVRLAIPAAAVGIEPSAGCEAPFDRRDVHRQVGGAGAEPARRSRRHLSPRDGPDTRTNRFDSVVAGMELRGERVRLQLQGRINLRAEMAPEDLGRHGLRLGCRVTAVVPPEAIILLPEEP